MANDKRFVVKNGLTSQNIRLVDDVSDSNNSIIITMDINDAVSFSGDSGQLFSITDDLTGTIFSVNDISGIPSLEVDDDGTVRIAEFTGNILVGTDVDDTIHKLQILGSMSVESITMTGGLSANGSLGTSGQILTTDGTNVYWGDAPAGTGGGGSYLPTKLDSITTVNGQDTYNLTALGQAYTPSSINALLVSLNGVTQSPGDAFTISGSTITFIPALETGDVVDFIIDLGAAVETVSTTETDTLNTVTTRGSTTTNEITVGGITSTGKYVETVVALSGSTPSLAATNGTIATWTLPGNSTPTDGLSSGEFITLHIDNTAVATITWPTIQWTRGAPPELSTTAINVVHIWKVGTNLYGAALGELA